MDDWVDIAVFSRPGPGDPPEGRILYLEKHHIDAPTMTLEVVVDEAPERAGIDPFHKLIDRNPDDNVAAVQVTAPPPAAAAGGVRGHARAWPEDRRYLK